MPVSQTAEYALRAVTCLAQHDTAQTTQSIAKCTGVPLSYLPKVLQPLTRAEIVSAQRGVRGGYRLRRDCESLSVLEVVNCVDPIKRSDPGQEAGTNQDNSLHSALSKLLDEVQLCTQQRFAQTTIKQLASTPECSVQRHENTEIDLPGEDAQGCMAMNGFAPNEDL